MTANNFEQQRPRLFALAYRMLGSIHAAEDAVQDCWLRWQASNQDDVKNQAAWLFTTTTRLCLDYLKSAKVQREQYIGPWLPEPLLSEHSEAMGNQSGDAADIIELGQTLSYAVLTLLERMPPKERAVFILKEAFSFDHQEIADIIELRADHSRKLLSRARSRLLEKQVELKPSLEEHQKLFESFVLACGAGDLKQLLDLLAEDVQLVSDGGGVVRAALRPLNGKERLLRFFKRLQSQMEGDVDFSIKIINAQPSLWVSKDEAPFACICLECYRGAIRSIFVVRNPDKLAQRMA
ncbi:MAG: RNA polymerase sigma factor SigJ [Pseudomonadales bacterium]